VRELWPPPPRGGRSGSPAADVDVGLHGPARIDLFGHLHVAQPGRMQLRSPWLHEPHRVQLLRAGHAEQPPGQLVVHRSSLRLHVAHGTQLHAHCQRRFHRSGANANVARVRVRECYQWLHGPHLDLLQLSGEHPRPICVLVCHSRLHRAHRQKLQRERHRERRLDVHLRCPWLPRSGCKQLRTYRQHCHHMHVQRPWLHVTSCQQLQLACERRRRLLRRVLAAALAAAAQAAAIAASAPPPRRRRPRHHRRRPRSRPHPSSR
jgi:hypothetical protein